MATPDGARVWRARRAPRADRFNSDPWNDAAVAGGIMGGIMRAPSLLFAASMSTGLCHAQVVCNLGQPLNSPNQGNVGGGVYFDLVVNQTVTLQSLTYVASESTTGTTSWVNVFVGPSTWVGNVGTNPGPWLLVAATTPVPVTPGIDTVCVGVLNPAGANLGTVTFAPGTYGVALQAVGHSWGYQNGQQSFPAPGGAFTVVAGGAANVFLSLPSIAPRSMNGAITFALGGTPLSFPLVEAYGAGCYRNFRSFYELFPSSLFVDRGNTSMRLAYDATNNRYVASAGTTPVDTTVVTSPGLALLDDENRTVALAGNQPLVFPGVGGPAAVSTVEMCSNGYVNLAGTTPAVGSPSVATWLNGAATRIGNHHDLNPALGGACHYDFDAGNGAHVFSWLGVPTAGIAPPSPNTFQLAFFANGDVEFRWGTMSQAGGTGWPTLIGFTPGNGAADPGSLDLSAALVGGFATSGFDRLPLTLTATVAAVPAPATTLTTGNVTGTSVGVCFVSFASLPQSPAGLDLGIVGAPGCAANVDVLAGVGFTIGNLGAPAPGLTVTLPLPGAAGTLGVHLFCQSAWLDATQNALGIITSHGLRLRL
jgi:hypothetical protein